MGMDFNIKPVGGSAAMPSIDPSPDAAKATVQTLLPPHKAVTAPNPVMTSLDNPQTDSERLSRQVIIDRAAAEVVYRVVDNRTALVVRQFPDEARLRARAYLRAIELARAESANRNTDVSA